MAKAQSKEKPQTWGEVAWNVTVALGVLLLIGAGIELAAGD